MAKKMLEDAAAEAASIRKKSAELGQREGAEEAARLLVDTKKAIEEFWSRQETELAPVIAAIASRIIGSLPPELLLPALVRTAVVDHRGGASLLVLAAPGQVASLKAALGEDGSTSLSFKADPQLTGLDLVLVHPDGQSRLGLDHQIRALLPDRQP